MADKLEAMPSAGDNPTKSLDNHTRSTQAEKLQQLAISGSTEAVLTALEPFLAAQARLCAAHSLALPRSFGAVAPQRIEQEDAMQEARLAVVDALATWKPEKASFWTWAHQKVKNRLRSLLRLGRKRPMTTRPDGDLPESASPPPAVSQELRIELERGIEQLPAREALVIRLYYLQQCDQAEIGEQIGLSAERVRQLRNAALKKLRALKLDIVEC